MNYIFYYFGDIPKHVEHSINSVLNSDPNSKIFFCSEEKVGFKNVHHVKPSKVISDLTQSIIDLDYFKAGDQNPLWASSMMRMFYINDVAKHLNLNSYIHFDSDVMCYKSFDELSLYLNETKFNITPLMDEFLVFGYSYVPSILIYDEVLKTVCDILKNSDFYEKEFYNKNRLTEMKTLYIAYTLKPHLFNLLPVLPQEKIVFDPGSYGQYLGGVHYKRFSKKYINDEHIVGRAIKNKEIYITKINGYPKVKHNGDVFDLANLHVHKKNLQKFKPGNFEWKTR